MAATDPNQFSTPPPPDGLEPLSADALDARLGEEIGRAERHGTGLSCVMVVIDNLEEMAREHGGELPEQTLAYVAAALRGELRRFDRVGRPSEGELLIVLPGADGPVGEVVARRLLERLRTIKVETRGTRRPLQISLGLAPWRADMSTAELLARARSAARRRQNGEASLTTPEPARTAAADGAAQDPRRSHEGIGPAIGRPAPS
jgi:diguanylate cyclase (GGDEF)-like protein